ncbi:MAG TPA: hypothetical protein VNQ73_17835 [Ilumatobacter sp.]|nr:hypothetical protein [Ilumatobacter sp.]
MTTTPTPHSATSHRAARRFVPAFTAAALAVGLAACGDDQASSDRPVDPPADTIAPPGTVTPTVPPTTVAPGFEHPTGADEVVVEIGYEGGFMMVDAAFGQVPTLLVGGDGSRYVLGPVPAIYPGPLLPNVLVSQVGEDGIQKLLELAAEHGLLTEREYERNDMIADAPDTVVRISANGETYEHRAYALGFGDDETGDRAELQAFVEAATSELAMDDAAFEPEAYLLRATPVTDLDGYEIDPTVVDWPAESSLLLADAADCVEVPAGSVHELLADANQLTFFVQDDVTYQMTAKPQLPGASC